jgi:RNA polymerase sigma-70 factor (ECF subfamily)
VSHLSTEARSDAEHDYDVLFRDVAPVMWRTMYAYTGGRRETADDAVAEAFARALQHRSSIRDPVAWLYRVAFRIARAEMKRRPEGALPASADTPEPEEPRELMAALRRLSPNQRAAVVLHYYADLPIREVSRRMGTSVAAVKVHLHRGRRRLRVILGGERATDA